MTDIKPADPRGDAALYARQAARMLSGEHDTQEVIAQAATAIALALSKSTPRPAAATPAADPDRKRRNAEAFQAAGRLYQSVGVEDPQHWQLGVLTMIVQHERNSGRSEEEWSEVFDAVEQWAGIGGEK